MGEQKIDEQVSAPPLHSKATTRWQEVIKAGLSQEEREILLKKYPAPVNCCFLTPPKLNIEVSQALSESCRLRDQRIVKKQERLVASLSSVAKTLSALLLAEGTVVLPLIESLSDTSRLLLDTLREETMIRRSLVLTNVNATMRDILNTTPVDEFLFGSKLSETVKIAKQINQNADDLKISKVQQKPSTNAYAPTRTTVSLKAPPVGGKSSSASRPAYYRRQRQWRPRSRSPYRRRY